jgi:hypothetical protein
MVFTSVPSNQIKGLPQSKRIAMPEIVKEPPPGRIEQRLLRALRQWRYRPRGITTFEIPIQFTTNGVIY